MMNLLTNKVEITSQNHGFAVDERTMSTDTQVTHLNLNDKTVEGIRHKSIPAFSVQYHPEASPGPHDSHYLFDEFFEMINASKSGERFGMKTYKIGFFLICLLFTTASCDQNGKKRRFRRNKQIPDKSCQSCSVHHGDRVLYRRRTSIDRRYAVLRLSC